MTVLVESVGVFVFEVAIPASTGATCRDCAGRPPAYRIRVGSL